MRKMLLLVTTLLLLITPATAQQRHTPVLPMPDITTRGNNTILNGGFENSTNWSHQSLAFQTEGLICTIADCGTGDNTVGPRTDNGFVWFGGNIHEASFILQNIIGLTNNPGEAHIVEFYLWNGSQERSTDYFYAKYNPYTLVEIVEGTPPYSNAYAPVYLNITGLGDSSLIFGATSLQDDITNFALDDVTLHTNLPDLILNGGFDNPIEPLEGWTITNRSKDNVVCGQVSISNNCRFDFRGKAGENAILTQQLNITSPLTASSVVLGSFWGRPVVGGLLKAVLTLKYDNGTKQKVKVSADFNPFLDTVTPPGDGESAVYWKQYQLPAVNIPDNVIAGNLKIQHKSPLTSTTFSIDRVSVAVIPGVIPMP